MALEQVYESDEEEFHSIKSPGIPDTSNALDTQEDEGESVMEPPMHPVLSLQGPFEESIIESTRESEVNKALAGTNAERRRQELLDAQQYDDSWTTRWRQRTKARYHPLLKLMAQIVFGMHLLEQQQAKSNEEVVKILQTHVNEVDSFLERTAEDFDLAIADIQERIRHLKLPMEHVDVFNIMLDDKKFRTQLLDGNDKIEKIIDRTSKAMNAALVDVRQGAQATQELGKYLDSVGDRWPRLQKDIADVYGAMRGNQQGWSKYLKDLKFKGDSLNSNLVQLGKVIGEMSKVAAAASRRNRPSSRPISASRSEPSTPALRSKFSPEAPPLPMQRNMSLNKPLPREPKVMTTVTPATEDKAHPVAFAQRYEEPRQSPRSPARHTQRMSSAQSDKTVRPKTAGAPREARNSENRTSELAEFLKHSGPLRSNPPEPEYVNGGDRQRHDEKAPTRSHSQRANGILDTATTSEPQSPKSRAKTQGPTAVVLTSRPRSKGADMLINRPESSSADRAMSVRSMPAARKDSVSSTGFARRLSKRMKHHPPIDSSASARPNPAADEKPQAPDSAYSSSTDQHTTLPHRSSIAQISSSSPASARPPSRFALFPRTTPTEPRTPSIASTRFDAASLHTVDGRMQHHSPHLHHHHHHQQLSAPQPSSVSQASKSRGLGLRNFFHRKQRSQVA